MDGLRAATHMDVRFAALADDKKTYLLNAYYFAVFVCTRTTTPDYIYPYKSTNLYFPVPRPFTFFSVAYFYLSVAYFFLSIPARMINIVRGRCTSLQMNTSK